MHDGQERLPQAGHAGIRLPALEGRNDIYGKGLMSAISSVFNGNIDQISYDANNLNTKLLIERATLMAGKPNNSAILTISFEEVAEIIKSIPENSPQLKIQWFGCQGTGGIQTLITDREVASKASSIRFTGGSFSHSGPYKTLLKYALSVHLNRGIPG